VVGDLGEALHAIHQLNESVLTFKTRAPYRAPCSDQVLARYASAEPLLKRSLAIWEKWLDLDHPQVAVCLEMLAALYRMTQREGEASQLEVRAATIRESQLRAVSMGRGGEASKFRTCGSTVPEGAEGCVVCGSPSPH